MKTAVRFQGLQREVEPMTAEHLRSVIESLRGAIQSADVLKEDESLPGEWRLWALAISSECSDLIVRRTPTHQ